MEIGVRDGMEGPSDGARDRVIDGDERRREGEGQGHRGR
jgi:hypothetical protein